MTTTIPAGWKPISSAPKDGSLILLGCPDEGPDGRPALCLPGHWLKGWGDAPDEKGQDDGWVAVTFNDFFPGRSFGNPDYMYEGSQPTHWMPLPAAPGAETPEESITVTVDPDPRGVSVGVWQGSRCIYTGADAVPVAQGDAQDERQVDACPRCNGSGEVTILSDNSPDAHDIDMPCDHCHGSGAAVDAAKYLAAALAGEKFRHMQLWAEYRNFHRSLCSRFGYGHDEVHFRRDLVSLEEAIAAKVSSPAAGDALGELLGLLQDLHALVWGECPSLLNEDSGGNSALDMKIRDAIAAQQGKGDGA